MLKINKVFLLLVITTNYAIAQTSTSSPYSRYGIGDVNSSPFAHYYGMGSLNIPLADMQYLNVGNPASYSFIGKYRPIMDIGISSNFMLLSTENSNQPTTTVALRNFAMGLPFSNRWGGSFGLLPYSSVGYDITNTEYDATLDSIQYIYKGSGGINKAYIGTAYKFINSDNHKLSVGFNANYLFGTILHERRVVFPASTGYFNSLFKDETVYGDFVFDIGLQYKGKVNDKTQLLVGANFSTPASVKATRSDEAFSFDGFGINDTIQLIDSINGTIKLPKSLGYGIALIFNNKFTVGIQYKLQDWADYEENFNNTIISDQLKNSSSLSFGMRYTPIIDNRRINEPLFKIAEYRMGLKYANTYLQLNETQLTNYGISFGIGLPLRKSASTSMINLGVEAGQRGTLDNNLIKEQYINVYFGLSLSPHVYDTWFRKRKYN